MRGLCKVPESTEFHCNAFKSSGDRLRQFKHRQYISKVKVVIVGLENKTFHLILIIAQTCARSICNQVPHSVDVLMSLPR